MVGCGPTFDVLDAELLHDFNGHDARGKGAAEHHRKLHASKPGVRRSETKLANRRGCQALSAFVSVCHTWSSSPPMPMSAKFQLGLISDFCR